MDAMYFECSNQGKELRSYSLSLFCAGIKHQDNPKWKFSIITNYKWSRMKPYENRHEISIVGIARRTSVRIFLRCVLIHLTKRG